MLIRRAPRFTASEITDPKLYLSRRELMAGAAALALVPGGGEGAAPKGEPLAAKRNPAFSLSEAATKIDHATTYNNFYEFGVKVDGLVHKPKTFDIDELIKLFPLEERVYSLRCVEAWSMVVPWIGFPLAPLLRRVEPAGQAKFVEFTTLLDSNQFPAQKPGFFGFSSLDWPYVEGLRLDEALHPLTLLTVGMYGQVLPNQNGAPVRVVVPWKYGFKSAKSIVRIRLVTEQPKTSWEKAASQEYGFYSNVNPAVSHPRWSQADERRIGEFRRRPTLPFNGYADQVASLYTGMDLKKFY